jgi:hypothetical protein
MLLYKRAVIGGVALIWMPCQAFANDVAENGSWQFESSADQVNKAAMQDMIQKKRSGYYAAPVYNTTVQRQYNCNVSASAQGNQGTNTTVANSPTTSGASASATGNDNVSSVDGYSSPSGTSAIDGAQANNGSVSTHVNGSTNTSVHGDASQALNSTQTNSGAQTASISGATGCAFGALN